MATKAKAEPERARSEAPALTHLPNILVDQVSGEILKRRIKPRLNALENLMFPKVTIKAAAKAMSSDDVRLAAERQGVTADQYLELNRVKAARGSAECRRLRSNKQSRTLVLGLYCSIIPIEEEYFF